MDGSFAYLSFSLFSSPSPLAPLSLLPSRYDLERVVLEAEYEDSSTYRVLLFGHIFYEMVFGEVRTITE